MVYKKVFLFASLGVWMACNNTPQTQQNTEGVAVVDTTVHQQTMTVSPIVDKVVRNYTIVPKRQFGDMTPSTTESDLKRIYGDSNVVRVDRGLVQTVVLPNSGSEIEIAWKKGQTFKKIESIFVRQGKFQTPEGIHIGSTLKDLEAANGKPVKLVPVNDDEMRPIWDGGKVNPQLVLSYDSYKDRVFAIQINF
ncbi:MAG: hypothetical protein JNL70_12445 [Saprospiraceae bacterium]|nr:hypothetical protein [Saprospiraceae bacterium]